MNTWDKEQQILESTIMEILKSRAKSRVYLYLLYRKGSRTEDIVRGTHLHPSTVRELLAQMHSEGLIIREKTRSSSVGKNPYKYYPLPPTQLIRKYIAEMEERLNKLIQFSSKEKTRACIEIKLCEEET